MSNSETISGGVGGFGCYVPGGDGGKGGGSGGNPGGAGGIGVILSVAGTLNNEGRIYGGAGTYGYLSGIRGGAAVVAGAGSTGAIDIGMNATVLATGAVAGPTMNFLADGNAAIGRAERIYKPYCRLRYHQYYRPSRQDRDRRNIRQ